MPAAAPQPTLPHPQTVAASDIGAYDSCCVSPAATLTADPRRPAQYIVSVTLNRILPQCRGEEGKCPVTVKDTARRVYQSAQEDCSGEVSECVSQTEDDAVDYTVGQLASSAD